MRNFIILGVLVLISFTTFAQKNEYSFFDVLSDSDKVTSFKYVETKKLIFAGTEKGQGIVIDETGYAVQKFELSDKMIAEIYASPDQSQIAFSGIDGVIHIVNTSTLVITDKITPPVFETDRFFRATFTNIGIFVGSNFIDNTPVNYLYVNGQLKEFKGLDSYVIYDYSITNNTLLVGFWDKRDRLNTVKVKQLFNYNLIDKSLKNQQIHVTPVWKAFYLDNGKIIVSNSDIIKCSKVSVGDNLRKLNSAVYGSNAINKIGDTKVLIITNTEIAIYDTNDSIPIVYHELAQTNITRHAAVLSDKSVIYLQSKSGQVNQIK